MIAFDIPPKLEIPKPSIIRPAEHSLLRPGAFAPVTRVERRAIVADLVRAGRLAKFEVDKAILFMPAIGWPVGGIPPTLDYRGVFSSGSNTSSYSIGSVDIGTAGTNRTVVIVFTLFGISGTPTAPTVTIGDISATNILTLADPNIRSSMYAAAVPTGATATVAVTASTSCYFLHGGAWAVYDLVSMTPHDTASSLADPAALNTDIPEEGVWIGYSFTDGGQTGSTWTNATERYEVTGYDGGNNTITGADYMATAAEEPRMISVNIPGTTRAAAVAASFR